MTDVSVDPVLLCNDLGGEPLDLADAPMAGQTISTLPAQSSGHVSLSVKEAVRIAKTNNFMGLVCSSRLLVRDPLPQSSPYFSSLTIYTEDGARADRGRQSCRSGPRVEYEQ